MSREHRSRIHEDVARIGLIKDNEPFKETVRCEVAGNKLRSLLRRVLLPKPADKYYQNIFKACLVGVDSNRLVVSATTGRSWRFQTLAPESMPLINTKQTALIDGRLFYRFVNALTLNEVDKGAENKLKVAFSKTGMAMVSPLSNIATRLRWLHDEVDIWAENIPAFLKELKFSEECVYVSDSNSLIKDIKKVDTRQMVTVKNHPTDEGILIEQGNKSIKVFSDGRIAEDLNLFPNDLIGELRNLGSRGVYISTAKSTTHQKKMLFPVFRIPGSDFFSITMSYVAQEYIDMQ